MGLVLLIPFMIAWLIMSWSYKPLRWLVIGLFTLLFLAIFHK